MPGFAFNGVPLFEQVSRPGSGRGGRLPPLHVGLFRCSREPEVSLPRRSRARRPHTARPPPRPRSTSFRALWTDPAAPILPATRLDSTIGQPASHARKSVRMRAPYPARTGEKRYKYITLGKQTAAAAAAALILE